MAIVSKKQLLQLLDVAKSKGATDSAIVESSVLKVHDHLAALCDGEYRCPNYGLSAGCSPHVEGPGEFRLWQRQSQFAVTVKIELPTSILFSNERKGVMQLLHHIVAAVEKSAKEMGYKNTRGFAGGSCKELFCEDLKKCAVLENDTCPHKEYVRPSISGFGIDVIQMMKSSGWPVTMAEKDNADDRESMSWVAGLVLVF